MFTQQSFTINNFCDIKGHNDELDHLACDELIMQPTEKVSNVLQIGTLASGMLTNVLPHEHRQGRRHSYYSSVVHPYRTAVVHICVQWPRVGMHVTGTAKQNTDETKDKTKD